MTAEQRIRGADGGVDWALLATGYNQGVLEAVERAELSSGKLADRGALAVITTMYRTDYTLTASELDS